jgi:hypothetical protein
LKGNSEGYDCSVKVELVKVYRRILLVSKDKEEVVNDTMGKIMKITTELKRL